jgi:hypothetical protein
MIGSNPLTKPLAPRSSANRGGGPYSLRSNQEAVPSRDSATVVARSSQSLPPSRHRWSFLRLVDYHVLLPPFAFQRALPRFLLTARSWLQGDVCFLCLPPGFPAVPPYLTHTCAAFAQRATMLALTPPPHQTPGGSVPRSFGVQVEVGSFPLTVGSFKRVAARHDFSYRIAPTGSLGRGGKASPDRACLFPTAQSRTTPEFPGAHPLPLHAPAGGFITTRRLALPRAPYSRVRDPIARSFASEPPGPRLATTPYRFGYPAQERSTGAGFAPARCTPCRAYECGSL